MGKYKEKIRIHAKVVEEIAQSDQELIDIVKQSAPRVVIPSSHLGFFRTIYAHIGVANRNGVILSRESVENSLDTLIQSQVNFEHFRKGNICGQVMDAWINADDAIEIVFAFHKGVYQERFEEAKDKLSRGELNVSFELLSDKSTQKFTEDGNVILNDVDFQGVGFLFDHAPADPEANVLEMAKIYKERAEHIPVEDRELVFANKIIDECNEVLGFSDTHDSVVKSKLNEEKGGNEFMNEEQKKLIDELRAEFGDTAKDISDEDLLNEQKVAELRESIADNTSEEKADETPEEETKEESEEEPKEETEDEEKSEEESKEESEDKSDENSKEEDSKEETEEEETKEAETSEEEASEETSEDKSEEEAGVTEEVTQKTTFDVDTKEDGTEVMTETLEVKKVTTFATVEEAEAKITELEAKIEELEATLDAKNSDIEAVRAEAETIGKRKIELKDNQYAAKFTDEDYLNEDKIEKAKLLAENDSLKKALEAKEETPKAEKVEVKASVESLETGTTEVEEESARNLLNRIR